MVVLQVFRDAERDAGGWVGQKWKFSVSQLLNSSLHVRMKSLIRQFTA